MWVEFFVRSRPRSRGFSPGYPVFLPPRKNNSSKFEFDLETANEELLCGYGTAIAFVTICS